MAKHSIWRFTKKTRSSERLWCFLGIHICALRWFTAYDSVNLRGRRAAEFVLGYTPDISAYVCNMSGMKQFGTKTVTESQR